MSRGSYEQYSIWGCFEGFGLYRVYIGVIGIMEKKMETTDYLGFRD